MNPKFLAESEKDISVEPTGMVGGREDVSAVEAHPEKKEGLRFCLH